MKLTLNVFISILFLGLFAQAEPALSVSCESNETLFFNGLTNMHENIQFSIDPERPNLEWKSIDTKLDIQFLNRSKNYSIIESLENYIFDLKIDKTSNKEYTYINIRLDKEDNTSQFIPNVNIVHHEWVNMRYISIRIPADKKNLHRIESNITFFDDSRKVTKNYEAHCDIIYDTEKVLYF